MLEKQSEPDFFQTIVAWQAVKGRHSLPWQNTRDPYRVWLSEIMLQQTQVSAVLGYYEKFIERFPSVFILAQAQQDDVLAAWSGLGYYSRARNLHLCAQRVVAEWAGHFPPHSETLAQLPGIGPSTAAAIAAFCFGERVSIFDGNVKRVLARYHGFDEDLSQKSAEKKLMTLAQCKVTMPSDADIATAVNTSRPNGETGCDAMSDMARYTQGLMDLGATVCTRHQPACADCPLAGRCEALRSGNQLTLPFKSRRTQRSTVRWWLLVLRLPGGRVWLAQRPATGIWARMYCFPVFNDRSELDAVVSRFNPAAIEVPVPVTHALTHRDLILQPVVASLPDEGAKWDADLLNTVFGGAGQWVQPGCAVAVGVPAPVSRWLAQWGESTG